MQIYLYKNQFYKHKSNIKKSLITCGINSWLWHKVPTWHNFLLLFFLYMIVVNVYLQLDTTSVVIFSANHFRKMLGNTSDCVRKIFLYFTASLILAWISMRIKYISLNEHISIWYEWVVIKAHLTKTNNKCNFM